MEHWGETVDIEELVLKRDIFNFVVVVVVPTDCLYRNQGHGLS